MTQTEKEAKHGKGRLAVKILLGLLILLVLVAVSVFALWKTGAASFDRQSQEAQEKLQESMQLEEEEVDTESEEGIVTYHGKKYRYNEDIITGLFMGLDGLPQTSTVWAEAPRCDCIILASMDTKNRKLTLIPLSRDIFCALEAYDSEGNFLGTVDNHLCIGYTYGDGGKASCEMMVRDVSNVMRCLPIHYYIAFGISGVGPVVDRLGGVTVTALDDDLNIKPYWIKKGDQVTLWGSEAVAYVHYRDTSVDGSNNNRMARQKQFLSALMDTAKTQLKKNPALLFDLMDSFSGYYQTDITPAKAAYLAGQVVGNNYEMQYVSLAGENVYGQYADKDGFHDVFELDEDALYETILSVYYEEV